MNVFRALLLSSTSQAETFVCTGMGLLAKKQYRLLASQPTHAQTDTRGDTYTLCIYRITYPHKQEGQGWGEPVIAERAHKTCTLQGPKTFRSYLRRFDIDPNDGWGPVEEEGTQHAE